MPVVVHNSMHPGAKRSAYRCEVSRSAPNRHAILETNASEAAGSPVEPHFAVCRAALQPLLHQRRRQHLVVGQERHQRAANLGGDAAAAGRNLHSTAIDSLSDEQMVVVGQALHPSTGDIRRE